MPKRRRPLALVADAWRRPACAALAVLAAGCLLATVAGARSDLAARTRALHATVAEIPAQDRAITGTADYLQSEFSGRGEASDITKTGTTIYDRLAPRYPVQSRGQAWAELAAPPVALVSSPPLIKADEFELSYRENLARHAALVSGRWPTTSSQDAAGDVTLEVAMTAPTLARFGAHLGSRLSFTGLDLLASETYVVVGVLAPRDPTGPFWQTNSVLATPLYQVSATTPPFWTGGAFIGPVEIDDMAEVYAPGSLRLSWTVPIATDRVDADNAAALDAQLSTVQTVVNDPDVAMQTGFDATLRQFLDEQDTAMLETAMPTVSLAVIAVIAALMLGGASVERRSAEFTVLRARGGPLWFLLALVTADAIATVVPASLVAGTVATLLPGTTPHGEWWRASLVPLVALVAPAGWTVLRYARANARRVATSARRTTVRTVVLVAVVALCLGGLEQVHVHGVANTGISGGVNVYAAAAPVLAAVLAALVALTVGPYLLRILLSVTARGRGAVGLLGIARTARNPAPVAVTVFILTLALCTADLALALHPAPARPDDDPLRSSTSALLGLLAVLAIAGAAIVVALATAADARGRRLASARLATMGLSARQARAITLTELSGPVTLAAAAGSAVAIPLVWTVRPALGQIAGATSVRLGPGTLSIPVLAVLCVAVIAGFVGAAVAGRDAVGSLRLGDADEGN